MLVAAGRDQIVSTAAIEDIAIRLRAGSHLIVAGARHELMMEQDRYRVQFWAAFDAFVPGTPLFGDAASASHSAASSPPRARARRRRR